MEGQYAQWPKEVPHYTDHYALAVPVSMAEVHTSHFQTRSVTGNSSHPTTPPTLSPDHLTT